MADSLVSWQSAFWSLPPLALNTMMQPSGRVCGFHPSLRTYLRSSPIVCAVDAILILLRLAIYICRGDAPSVAAQRVRTVRSQGAEHMPLAGGLQELEQMPFLRIFWFVFGTLSQLVKLAALRGVPWTQVWGGIYVGSFLVVEGLHALSRRTEVEVHLPEKSRLERWLERIEHGIGGAAVLLQLGVLATVDLAGIPPDRNVTKRWKFRSLRLVAHFVPVFIYLPFVLAHAEDPVVQLRRRIKSLVLAMLLVNVLLTTLHTLNYRFSHLYVLWSLAISTLAWMLFFYPQTKRHVLLCGAGASGYMNVCVFDFFCRILCFSLFWYVWYYDPNGTVKPRWTNNLG